MLLLSLSKDFCKRKDKLIFYSGENMQPLEGIRVIDLSRVVSGPYCTMILGDFGAEVIKIEHPEQHDETRAWGPPFAKNRNDSAYYLAVNRNKKALCLDLKSPEGKEILRKLLEQADVLVENFRVGTLDKLGFSYEDVSKINPQLIYCSISGFGKTGPYAHKGGYDVLIQAMGGLMSITGSDEPMKVGLPVVDITTGMLASNAIIAALFARSRNGRGQMIDTSLLESQVSWLANAGSNYLVSGKLPERHGNKHPNIAPYQPYKASDGQFIVTVTNDKLWKNFCEAIDKPELINNPKFKDNPSRVKNRTELDNILEEIFIIKNVNQWIEIFESKSVPAGPVNNLEQVFRDPQVLHREMLVEIEHSTGPVRLSGIPVKFSETKASVRLAPPLPGEHNKDIICGLLKYSQEEFEQLKTLKVI